MRTVGAARGHPARAWGDGAEAAAAGLTLAYNVILNRLLPDGAYVPVNTAAAALSVLLARRYGVSWEGLGLEPRRLPHGLRVGLALVVPVAAALALGAALPATRVFYRDARAIGASAGETLYQALLRIPVGTAVAEETIFRGSLLGLFLRRGSRARAVALSSTLFGLWHVLPTMATLPANPAGALLGPGSLGRAAAVGAGVVFTGIAGAGLAWLRLRSGSLAVPVVVHAGLNSLAFVAARLVGGQA